MQQHPYFKDFSPHQALTHRTVRRKTVCEEVEWRPDMETAGLRLI